LGFALVPRIAATDYFFGGDTTSDLAPEALLIAIDFAFYFFYHGEKPESGSPNPILGV